MALVGGTVSRISGGKFADGAVSSAFQHMFNDEGGMEKFIHRLKRAFLYSEVYYNNTMDSMSVLGKNIGEKVSGTLTVTYMNKQLEKNIFYKNQYGIRNVIMSKSSIPFIERIVTKGLEPFYIGETAFEFGVRIGSGIKGLYYEFGR